ncbi:MAG: hypothetical protein GC205_10405 [Bacteroidetes bacterium]|nr:hypothetical protein [Bacteroidota bacterium]
MKTLLPGLLFAVIMGSLPQPASAQVLYDFEDGSIDGWVVELDGIALLNALGNPGNCLLIDDQALGSVNQLVAPFPFTGDWSAAGASDSLRFDLYARRISGFVPVDGFGLPLVTLSGPGGTATIATGFVPILLSWETIAFPLDSTAWTMVSGNWQALMENVEVLKIRSEYVDGSEETKLDNIQLSFSPIREIISETQCTDWSTPGNLEGWSFQFVAGAAVDTVLGLPPGSARIGDKSGILSNAVAPPKYLGSWAALDGNAQLSLDLRIFSSSGTLTAKNYLVRLSGPGGVATYQAPSADYLAARVDWKNFLMPIVDTFWTLQSGTWSDLLDLVTEVRLEVEFIQGSETVYLDNFCLEVLSPLCSAAPEGQSAVGNANGSVSLSWDPVPGSVACRVRGRIAGTPTWRFAPPIVAPEPTGTNIPAPLLTPGASYEWQVLCACSLSPLVLTPFSATGAFVAPSPRLSAAAVNHIVLTPNPATAQVQLNGLTDQSPFTVLNAQGAVVAQGLYSGSIDVQHLAPGWYVVSAGANRYPFVKAD